VQNSLYNELKYDTIITDGIILFKNQNTTLGFVRFNDLSEIEYIFVQPTYRRKGLAKKLLNQVKSITNREVIPQEPISNLGRKLFKME